MEKLTFNLNYFSEDVFDFSEGKSIFQKLLGRTTRFLTRNICQPRGGIRITFRISFVGFRLWKNFSKQFGGRKSIFLEDVKVFFLEDVKVFFWRTKPYENKKCLNVVFCFFFVASPLSTVQKFLSRWGKVGIPIYGFS